MYEQTVVNGGTQNTYQEFVYTIPAGQTEPVYYDFNYFRILTLTGNGALFIRFGDNSQETSFIGTGIGYSIPFVIRRCAIRNAGPDPVTIRLALGIGEITDDRINFDPAAVLPVQQERPSGIVPAQVSLAASTAGQLVAIDATRQWVSIQAGSEDLYIGPDNTVDNTTGFLVQAGTTYSVDATGEIWGFSVAASTVYVNEGI